jgi:ABC-type polysaccharide/polyol phosphate export permease
VIKQADDVAAVMSAPAGPSAALRQPGDPREDARDDRRSVRKIEFVFEGGRRASVFHGLRDVWAFREVAWAFAERSVRVKYKQAVLGIAWAVIQPLAFLVIFTVIFGRVAGLSNGRSSYPAETFSALVPWMFLQSSLSFGAQALQSDGALVRKVYFAREASVLGAVIASCLDFAVGLGLLFALAPVLGTRITWAAVLVLPLWLLLAILASGLALGLGALAVYYRDVRYALPLLLQLWMFGSPVAYPLTTVPERWRTLYVLLNPAVGLLDGFRRTLGEGQMVDPALLAVSAASTVLVAWTGYVIFKRLEPGFADMV